MEFCSRDRIHITNS